MVTLPVFLIMALVPTVGWLARGLPGMLVGLVAGPALAWPWWSYSVPKWRDWVEDQGIAPEAVQARAEAIGLLWPRGHRFERTEFPRRDGRKGW